MTNGIRKGNLRGFNKGRYWVSPTFSAAEISLRISLRIRPEEPFLLLKYTITLSLILCSYY